jgi:hypothetical protein
MRVRQWIFILFALVLTGMTLDLTPQAASAQQCDYYASPDGSGNGLSESSPFQMSIFLSMSESEIRGKTLCLLDGTYYESLIMSKSGTASQPISIRALHDGEVTIDGEGIRRPGTISGNHNIVEGIVFQWSSGHTLLVSGSHNIIRRVSAYHSKWNPDNTEHAAEYNVHGILVTGTNNLVEDCVAAGAERHLFIDHNSQGRSQQNIFRRVFAACTEFGGCRSEFNFYGSSDSICENCIGWGDSIAKSISVHSATWNEEYKCQGNKVLGSMFLRSKLYGITTGYGFSDQDNYFENILLYGNNYGLRLYDDDGGGRNETVKNITIVGTLHPAIIVDSGNPDSTIKNTLIYDNVSAFSGSADHMSYINAFGNENNEIPNCTEGCLSVDPGFSPYLVRLSIPDDSPMKGAGENGSDIGANICYRYENGVLTNVPLWPWPMADRIKKELGIDVMAELEQLFGPIPAECKGVGSKEDINLDGSVNSMDVQLCANVLIGWEMDADIVKRADVNDDGVVNTSDVRQIVNRYLEGM